MIKSFRNTILSVSSVLLISTNAFAEWKEIKSGEMDPMRCNYRIAVDMIRATTGAKIRSTYFSPTFTTFSHTAKSGSIIVTGGQTLVAQLAFMGLLSDEQYSQYLDEKNSAQSFDTDAQLEILTVHSNTLEGIGNFHAGAVKYSFINAAGEYVNQGLYYDNKKTRVEELCDETESLQAADTKITSDIKNLNNYFSGLLSYVYRLANLSRRR